MTFSKYVPRNIERVARSVGHALWLGTNFETWLGVALIFKARLTPQQRAVVVYAALRSHDADDAAEIAALAIYCPKQEEVAA